MIDVEADGGGEHQEENPGNDPGAPGKLRGEMATKQARLLTMKAAWLMDTVGAKGARFEIAAIKVVAGRVATTVIDRAIQLFGAAGVSDDWPLAHSWS